MSINRRSFLASTIACLSIPLFGLSRKRVIDGRKLGPIVRGIVFDNVHFSHPLTVDLVEGCTFHNCSSDDGVLIRSNNGHDLAVLNNVFFFDSINKEHINFTTNGNGSVVFL